MSILISIASYSDPVLGFTLARALATARHPEALQFAVVDQSPATWPRLTAPMVAPAQLNYVRVDPIDARGPCWARAIAMSYYDSHDWFLQIDSHMDFDLHWDERLISQAQALLPGRKGVVISAYPNAFVFENGQPVRRPTTGKVLAHVVKPGARFETAHPVLGFEAHPVDSDTPVPGYHLGAGCLFAPGEFAQQFPYDPNFYFHGEEQALAARLYTRGWDIFHMPALPLHHLYNTGGTGLPKRALHWDESEDAQRAYKWWDLEQRSRQRLADLVAGKDLGVYGLGRERTMADYAALCGIDYATRTLAPQAYNPLPSL